MNNKRLVFSIAFFILGLVLSVQFRSTLLASTQKASHTLDIDKIISSIEEEKKIESQLRESIEANLKLKKDLINSYFETEKDDSLKTEWETEMMRACLTDVKGPGIIIEMDDADSGLDGDPRDLIIHDQDIRIILNELRKAGAQAISVKGERIVAMSEQVCAGPTILINKNRYTVPFAIKAIGDPEELYESLNTCQRIALMRQVKVRVEIKKSDEIVIPKYRDIHDIDLMKSISGLEVVKNEND